MNDQIPPYEAAMLLTREIGKLRAADYFRSALWELEKPEEKEPLLDEEELEKLEIIMKKVRAASE